MYSNQFGSLSPTPERSHLADDTGQLTTPDLLLSPDALELYLPTHDSVNDPLVLSLIRSVQRQIEAFTGVHATPRKLSALFYNPTRLIKLPYGPHKDIVVKQGSRSQPTTEYDVTQAYRIIGVNFAVIHLEELRPTVVEFTSGCGETPDQLVTAVRQEVGFQFKNRNDVNLLQAESKNGLSLITRNSLTNLDYSAFEP